jgi:glycosyltransferase involved in cell wall biosynthesis
MKRVRYVGFLGEASGYGEAARSHLLALAGAGVDVAARSVLFSGPAAFDAPPDRRRFPKVARLVRPLRGGGPVLVHTPPHSFRALRERRGIHVGISAWEMESLPPSWRAPVAEMDAIWAPSRFCADAFAAATARPVTVIPHPVRPPAPGPRRFPGVPDDLFLFASVFEWSDRKNPEGLVRAFLDAFAGRRDVGLLLKIGLRFHVAPAQVVASLRRLTAFTRPPVYALLGDEAAPATLRQIYRRADAYVSLHRAEGFGLGMAEAMAAGKPVVATGWSGNLEYMDAQSAFLVEGRMVPVRQRLTWQALFGRGMRWVEPDHDAAVAALRSCADSAGDRQRRAAAGRARVLGELDPARVGALMKAALVSHDGRA